MKKINVLVAIVALMVAGSAAAKDIRVVEISMGDGMKSSSDSNITSILGTIAGVSRIVSDVANLILTVTYDADEVGVDDIVKHINQKDKRFEAKQKSEPKTKKWVKAEKKLEKAQNKVDQERQEAKERDQERQRPEGNAPQGGSSSSKGNDSKGGQGQPNGGGQQGGQGR